MIFNPDEYHQEEKVFTGQDFSGVSFAGYSFSNCTFERCTFINSFWTDAKLYSCVFNACNISLVKVQNSLMQNITFNECKLVGIEFYKVNKTFFSMNATQCMLLHCNFSDLMMKGVFFAGSTLQECYFKNSQLENADFTRADLKETVFRNCNLTKANFTAAKNYALDITNNNVKKAQFSYPDVMSLLRYFDIVINYEQ